MYQPRTLSLVGWMLFCTIFITLLPIIISNDSVHDTTDELAKANGWVSPDAWTLKRARSEGNLNDPDSPTCECTSTNTDLSTETFKKPRKEEHVSTEAIFYKQLVNRLFNRKRFRFIDSETLSRTINIHLSKNQLEEIKKLLDGDNIHDLAELVTMLMRESNDNFVYSVKDEVMSIYETLHQYYIHLGQRSNQTRFVIYTIIFFLVTFMVARLTRQNFIFIVILAMPCIGFGSAYIKCNQQKELDQLISLKQKEFLGNPCDHVDKQQSWVSRLFFPSYKEACIEHLRKIGNHDSDFCEPMEVVIDYSAKLMTRVLKAAIELFTTSTEGKSYITQGIIGCIIVCLFVAYGKVTIRTTISSIFQHGFSKILSCNTEGVEYRQQQQPMIVQQEHSDGSAVEVINSFREFTEAWRQNMTQQEKFLDKLTEKGISVEKAHDLLDKLKHFEVAAVSNQTQETELSQGAEVEIETTEFEFVEAIENVEEKDESKNEPQMKESKKNN